MKVDIGAPRWSWQKCLRVVQCDRASYREGVVRKEAIWDLKEYKELNDDDMIVVDKQMRMENIVEWARRAKPPKPVEKKETTETTESGWRTPVGGR